MVNHMKLRLLSFADFAFLREINFHSASLKWNEFSWKNAFIERSQYYWNTDGHEMVLTAFLNDGKILPSVSPVIKINPKQRTAAFLAAHLFRNSTPKCVMKHYSKGMEYKKND